MSVVPRVERIRAALQAGLAPSRLELVDESHLHVGHAGAATGRGHYRLTIVSERFRGAGPVARHRLVYEALGELMSTDIHALAIRALTPEEA